MPAAEKRVKLLSDLVGAGTGPRLGVAADGSISLPKRGLEPERILRTVKERAQTLSDLVRAAGAAPAGKLNTVPIDRPERDARTKQTQLAARDASARDRKRPVISDEDETSGSAPDGMLCRKGSATAASFRPSYWSYEDRSDTTQPRGRRRTNAKGSRSRSQQSD